MRLRSPGGAGKRETRLGRCPRREFLVKTAPENIKLRSIALPAEHGSWGLVLEPIVLGLLVAPSWLGLLIGLAAFAVFLMRRPMKVLLANARGQGGRRRRSRIAGRFLTGYGVTAASCFAGALTLGGGRALLPLAAVSPLALLFLAYDVRNQSRSWQPEVAGAVVFASVTASIARAGGWQSAPALALSAALALRAIPAVLYVRARIRIERGRPAASLWPVLAHGAAVLAVYSMARVALLPWLAVSPFVVLFTRAALGLSRYRRSVTTTRLGFTEMAYGAMTVLLIAIGCWL